MKHTFGFVISLAVLPTIIFASSLLDQVPFEGPYNTGLEAVIENGVIETKQTDANKIEREIRNQLAFLVGAMNGYGGTIDLDMLEISDVTMNEETGKATYSAKVFIAWPKNYQVPQAVGFAIPRRGDGAGIKDYFARYSQRCSENPGSSELTEGAFFYYYRPQNQGCNANQNGAVNVVYSTLKVAVSGLNTKGKSPEYGKIWEDKELTATIISGTNEPGVTSNSDIGVAQYNTLYQSLWATYGTPKSMSTVLPSNYVPGFQYPDLEMNWVFADGRKLNINILLIDKYQLLSPGEEFLARLQSRIEKSDLVSYNGHSGLGVNIRALVRLGKYVAGKYQVFYFNGCDTFSYINEKLALDHQKVNPEFGKHKFVDFISNAMPSPFNGFASSNFALLNGMLGMKQTYLQILNQFSPMQRAVVMGEEDNNWPKPF